MSLGSSLVLLLLSCCASQLFCCPLGSPAILLGSLRSTSLLPAVLLSSLAVLSCRAPRGFFSAPRLSPSVTVFVSRSSSFSPPKSCALFLCTSWSQQLSPCFRNSGISVISYTTFTRILTDMRAHLQSIGSENFLILQHLVHRCRKIARSRNRSVGISEPDSIVAS